MTVSTLVHAMFGTACGVLFLGLFTGDTQHAVVEAFLVVRHPRQWWSRFRADLRYWIRGGE